MFPFLMIWKIPDDEDMVSYLRIQPTLKRDDDHANSDNTHDSHPIKTMFSRALRLMRNSLETKTFLFLFSHIEKSIDKIDKLMSHDEEVNPFLEHHHFFFFELVFFLSR